MKFAAFFLGVFSFLKTVFVAVHGVFAWVGSRSVDAGPMFVKSVLTGLTVASAVAHTGSVGLTVVAGGLTAIGSFFSRL